MGWYRWDGGDLLLSVRVQPRASRDEIIGPQDDHLKVRITAPPVDGEANAYLLRYLAEVFKVSKRQVTLLSGETGRVKRLRIEAPRVLPEGMEWPERGK